MEVKAAAITSAMVEVMAAAITAAMVEVMAAAITSAMVEVMAAAITDLMLLTLISPQVQKAGKIGVMAVLLKTQNMKVVEVEEKEEFPMRVIYQMRKINNPFPQVLKLI